MSGSGKGGDSQRNRRRPFKRRERETSQPSVDSSKNKKAVEAVQFIGEKFEKKRGGIYERPRWKAQLPPDEPLPVADCAWCGKPIKDMASAISEHSGGSPVHFDCVIARLGEGEKLEQGDSISYIGGGRFAVIHFNNPPDTKDFKIKKIFEWENKENRSEWRQVICDHFSVT
jgi:hypothetical protein